MLIWDQRHVLSALREFEVFYNGHRPHQGIANARDARVADLMTYAKALDVLGPVRAAVDVLTAS